MILLLSFLLATPSLIQAASTTNTSMTPPAVIRENQEFMAWTGRRVKDLNLGDDQSQAVWTPQEKPQRLSALAQLISDDRRLLWRYTMLLKTIQMKKGRVNSLDLDLSTRIWSRLKVIALSAENFKDTARAIGVTEPSISPGLPSSGGGSPTLLHAGDERYDTDTGGYEVYAGSGTWKPK